MDEKKEEYQVIQEQIVPKKKNRRRWWKTLLRISISAVVFGIIAGAVLVISGKYFIKKFGLEDELRKVVEIGKVTPAPTKTPTPTVAPAPTKQPDLTEEPVATSTPAAPDFVIVPPETTPEITVTIDEKTEGETEEDEEQNKAIRDFLELYSGIQELSEKLNRSLVCVTAITEGVDWFEESYETTEEATGLYVGDNGVDMLFLVNLDSVEGATKFEITFANGKAVPCTIYSYDTNYRLAVLAVRLSQVSEFEEDEKPVKVRFAVEDTHMSTPVMMLGKPNGQMGTMELGMVTGVGKAVQVMDDEVRYFTTDITEYETGDGFAFNLSGEVIGIASNTLRQGENGVMTATMLSSMRSIVEDILNNVPRIYCGLYLDTVDVVMSNKYNLPSGVYVEEVLPGSPALNAGIKNGDVIINVGISPVTDVRGFYEEIRELGAQSIRIIVCREVKGEWKEQTMFMTPSTRAH